MTALHDKYLWPLTGVIVFAVLAAFYIDDRRRLANGNSTMTSDESSSSYPSSATASDHQASAEPMYASKDEASHAPLSSNATHVSHSASNTSKSSSTANHKGFSGSIDDYLAQINIKRSAELRAAAKNHQGFSGSIDDYLRGDEPTQMAARQSSPTKTSIANSTSMSMDEYLAKTANTSHSNAAHSHSGNAYSGSLEGYLAKFGNGEQTPISTSRSDPFQTEEHMGFHGSYEEYAKKYN